MKDKIIDFLREEVAFLKSKNSFITQHDHWCETSQKSSYNTHQIKIADKTFDDPDNQNSNIPMTGSIIHTNNTSRDKINPMLKTPSENENVISDCDDNNNGNNTIK